MRRNISKDLEYLKLDQISLMPGNAREHPDEQISDIRASIRKFGVTMPLLIDENNVLIAGEGRLIAARLENLKEIPCRRYSGLSDTEKEAYSLIDNKLGLKSKWNPEKLNKILENIANEFSAKDVGFDEKEIQRLQDDLLKTALSAMDTQEKTNVSAHERSLPKEDYAPFSFSLPIEQRDFVIFALKKYAESNQLENSSVALYELCKEKIDESSK